jgi:hypothetical protein
MIPTLVGVRSIRVLGETAEEPAVQTEPAESTYGRRLSVSSSGVTADVWATSP